MGGVGAGVREAGVAVGGSGLGEGLCDALLGGDPELGGDFVVGEGAGVLGDGGGGSVDEGVAYGVAGEDGEVLLEVGVDGGLVEVFGVRLRFCGASDPTLSDGGAVGKDGAPGVWWGYPVWWLGLPVSWW